MTSRIQRLLMQPWGTRDTETDPGQAQHCPNFTDTLTSLGFPGQTTLTNSLLFFLLSYLPTMQLMPMLLRQAHQFGGNNGTGNCAGREGKGKQPKTCWKLESSAQLVTQAKEN